MATSTDDSLNGNEFLFHQLDAYPWDADEEFQGGLQAILGSVQDPSQIAHLTLRAKCYYYARKAGTAVDFDGYKAWVESQAHDNTNTNGMEQPTNGMLIHHSDLEEGYDAPVNAESDGGGMTNAPKPASFAEICDMISEGKPIPGIKDIPDTILEGQASDSRTTRRKKPWEKDEETAAEAGAAEAGNSGEKLSWMR
ncbi:hypothetical protein LTR56_024190 [Elasticomyces elasticus]|nr:hypothetical protein LTR56_024190 [Elasticomyces elasticus]KAK3640583.1 hypothetical protein LTR22_016959 [Elasticomyces elasticus]KAK4910215.1 hypothetical protein LTR49_021106 [Elasticomyces elasticus]KAK5759955.1 hypothetical protein LTS12_009851 [Elasticomyces elasticus]